MSLCTLTVLVALASGLGPGPRMAAAAAPDPVAASEREVRAGSAAYDAGDYTRALEHFKQAYALHPSPAYLYAWAQAARNAGDCATAVDLYRRFIEAGASGVSLEAAQQNEARCAEVLAAQVQADEAASEPAPELEPVPSDDPSPSVHETPRDRPRPPPDGLGIALVVTGGAALATGAAVLAIAGARHRTQSRQTTYQRFDDLDAGIDRLYLAGGVTLGVGAALAIAGAVRLGTRSRRARGPTHALVLPMLDAHGTPMVLVRFTAPRVFAPLRRRGVGHSTDTD